MNEPRHPLTPEVQEQICAFIRAGSFPQVAAQAVGIPVKVFESWMRYGNALRPLPIYRDFREAVLQAQAIARLAAESRALQRAPLSWLRFGPGRHVLPGPDASQSRSSGNGRVRPRVVWIRGGAGRAAGAAARGGAPRARAAGA